MTTIDEAIAQLDAIYENGELSDAIYEGAYAYLINRVSDDYATSFLVEELVDIAIDEAQAEIEGVAGASNSQ